MNMTATQTNESKTRRAPNGPKRLWRLACGSGAAAALCVAFMGMSGPDQAAAAQRCFPVGTGFTGGALGGNIPLYTETLTAEVCINPFKVVWMQEAPSDVAPTCSSEPVGGDKGVFWDSLRYGGAYTLWADEVEKCSGVWTYLTQYSYERIWVTPSGRVYTYAGH